MSFHWVWLDNLMAEIISVIHMRVKKQRECFIYSSDPKDGLRLPILNMPQGVQYFLKQCTVVFFTIHRNCMGSSVGHINGPSTL